MDVLYRETDLIPDTPDYNANAQIKPLRRFDNLDTDKWFAHGYKAYPPVEGAFLELPSGGNLMGKSTTPSSIFCHALEMV